MALDGTLLHTSNKMFEMADYLEPPDREQVLGHLSQEECLKRLNDLESPSERLMTLAKSVLTIQAHPTHEANWIKTVAISSFIGGFSLGALFKSKGVHQEYVRKHNASVFEGSYVGNRHFYDTLIAGIVPRGLGSKIYWPDWLVGLSTIGALSRLWLGPKAMLVGGLSGSAASVIALGIAKMIELVSGRSVTQLRLMNHQEWLGNREAKQRALQSISQETYYEKAGDDSLRLDIEG